LKRFLTVVFVGVLVLGNGQLVSAAVNKDQVLNTAKEYLGTPYSFGGNNESGFDCSGYTQHVYNKLGVDIPRTTLQQAYEGDPVSKDELKAGDLVFFKNTYRKGISHVGIYVGDNEFISATNDGVTTVSLSNPYWETRYAGGRRVAEFDKDQLFSDLTEDHVAFDAIKTLTDKNVINGYTDGSFKPSKSITRGQAAALLNNHLTINSENMSLFSDVSKNYRFAQDIASMKEAGIIHGYPDGTFRPNETITRGQMALIIQNAFDIENDIDFVSQTKSGMDEAIVLLSSIDTTNQFKPKHFNSDQDATRADFSIALFNALENKKQ